jgi:hypothetical protein
MNRRARDEMRALGKARGNLVLKLAAFVDDDTAMGL